MRKILFVFIILASLFVLAQENQNTQEQQTTNQGQAADNKPIPVPNLLVQQMESTEANQAASEENKKESRAGVCPENCGLAAQDLIQQRRMAIGTESLANDSKIQADYAFIALWINGVGLAFIFIALLYNIRASNAAKKSADAAIIALEQNRAWITYDERAEDGAILENDKPGIRFNWKNTGSSPALNVRLRFGDSPEPIIKPEDRYKFKIEALSFSDWHNYGAIGPGQSFPIAIVFTDLQVEDIQRADVSYILYFEILYDLSSDVEKFGRTEVTYEISFHKARDGAAFDYRIIGENNSCA